MPRRNNREERQDPRETEFWRSRNCTEEDPCYSRKPKAKKGKKRKRNGSSPE